MFVPNPLSQRPDHFQLNASTTMALAKALFTIDGLNGPFGGYHDGSTWNGWACPHFTKMEADRILESFLKQPSVEANAAQYDSELDEYVFEEDGNGPEPFGRSRFSAPDGSPLYAIGTAYWTWQITGDSPPISG